MKVKITRKIKKEMKLYFYIKVLTFFDTKENKMKKMNEISKIKNKKNSKSLHNSKKL